MAFGGGFGGGFRRGGGFNRGPRRDFGGPREMHKIKCSECGQDGEVPFKPSGDRPVLCRNCFMKKKGITPREESQPAPKAEAAPKEKVAEAEDAEEAEEESSEEEM